MTEYDEAYALEEALAVGAARDAERSVVGAALLDAESVRWSGQLVAPADFANTILGHIFGLIVAHRSSGLPVDPVTIDAAARQAGLRGVDATSLFDLMHGTPTAANAAYYAEIVREAAIRRRLHAMGTRAQQFSRASMPLTEAMAAVRADWDAVRGEASATVQALTLAAVLDGEDDYDWLIPNLLERMDRLILTGGEGAGKSTFVRQLAIMAAAGLHPTTFHIIEPVRVLVVDAENSEKQWRRAARPLAAKARIAGQIDPTQVLHLACVPRLDITTERDLGAVHALVDEHKPDLLVIGPLYRLIPRAINSDDDAAPLLAGLDTLRARGLALVMEAHAGHAMTAGGSRDLRPRGSSALMGWPEFGMGIQLDRDDPQLAHLVRWRGDRDERSWPRSLRRGGEWPWTDDARAVTPAWTPRYDR